MNISATSLVRLGLLLLFTPLSAWSVNNKDKADLSRLVIVGDSVSAGVENFSLLDTQQPNGYAALIAAQAGVPMTLPLVPYPGAPNVLQLLSIGPPPLIQSVQGSLPSIPRDNPSIQPTNLSIPGITVEQALTLVPTPSPSPTDPVATWANIVLGFPTPFLVPGPARTQIEQAIALKPTTIIVWLGNNDALIPVLFGGDSTPTATFAAAYKNVLLALSQTNATLVLANIPDITRLPFLTSAATLAQEVGLPLTKVTSLLGIGFGDYLRPSAVPIAEKILNGAPGPLSSYSCTGAPFSPAAAPCVLTATDAISVRSAVNSYNAIISSAAASFGATLVDIHSLFDDLVQHGYKTGGYCISTDFLGGLISLDGVHPTNTTYAIIANTFIHDMNTSLDAGIRPVSVAQIVKRDPLVLPSVHCGNGK